MLPSKSRLRIHKFTLLQYFLLIGVCLNVVQSDEAEYECGVKSSETYSRRIIGGRRADAGEFPWIIVLNLKSTRNPLCTGSILSPKWVLTAAHCFNVVSIAELQIEAGTSNLHKPSKYVSNIKKVYIPEEFDGEDPFHGFDLALVALSKPFHFSHPKRHVASICLPPEGSVFMGPVTAAGWGCTSKKDARTSWILQAIDVIIFPNTICENKFHMPIVKGVCAGVPSMCQRGVCQGDSGGPIQQYFEGRYVVVGILSYGHNGCAGVYTNIVHYLDWMARVLKSHGGL